LQTEQTFIATDSDESGVYVLNGGVLTLQSSIVQKTGDTSSDENSSFYGLNAGLLATSGSNIQMLSGMITTTGRGANGAFSTGAGTEVSLYGVRILATADGGHGVMATQGGAMTLENVAITTAGANSAAIATDRGGGTITATGGVVTTSGQDSPGIYSTGDITISGARISASGSESAVIEGANSITLTASDLSSSKTGKWGVMIYQSMSGDAKGTRGTFTMTGGSLTCSASDSPLFFVTNSTGVIRLSGVEITAASGVLVKAERTDRWGQSGANGGTVELTADEETLDGDLVADSISSITLTLNNNTTLTGAADSAHSAKAINLTLDASSTWNVTADSYVTCLTDPDGISGSSLSNVIGNGHTVYYDASACSGLDGLTYNLSDGGLLTPAP
jgi:hypothetical protein